MIELLLLSGGDFALLACRPVSFAVLISSSKLGESMPALTSSYTARVSQVVELLQGKWTVQILCAMHAGPVRLSELKRAIPSASKKALTARLRSLEAARVVLRRDLSSSVLRVEYEITEMMREPLSALLDQLAEWSRSFSPNGVPKDSAED